MFVTRLLPVALLGAAFSSSVSAALPTGDRYAVLHLDELVDALVVRNPRSPKWSFAANVGRVHVVLDVEGDAYVSPLHKQAAEGVPELLPPDGDGRPDTTWGRGWGHTMLGVAVDESAVGSVTGTLHVPGSEGGPGIEVPFEIPAEAFSEDAGPYSILERGHYGAMLDRDLPGAAWFRHQHDAAQARWLAAAVEQGRELGASPQLRNADRILNRSRSTVEDSFELFSGGRAVSENLQLDRTLPASPEGEDTVPVDSVQGITTPAYDWAALIEGLSPELDPLAQLIPADQHAVFFPSFEALVAVADHAEEHGTPVLAALEPRSESANTRQRYEQQLGVPMSALSRLLGPAILDSVAMTGSDPYLRTGSDVALIFEGSTSAVEPLLVARVRLAAQGVPGVTAVEGKIGDDSYTGFTSEDRSFCSYVAALGDRAVVVCNSLAQLERLFATARGDGPALASLDEYVWFRDRYQRGEEGESAFAMISDATIRRWCGPRWRIGSSRRSRAAAVVAEWQARSVDALMAEDAADLGPSGHALPEYGLLPGAGPMSLTAGGVRSEDYGSLGFATPIVELDLDLVTEDESDLYERWRRGYESNWSNFFDPIGIRFSVDEQQLAMDMTVRPLIAGSDYRDYIGLSAGAELDALSGDPHEEALVHWVSAFNRNSPSLSRAEVLGLARMLAPKLDPLGWVGSSYSLYIDKDDFWAEMAAAEDGESFLFEELYRLPMAVHVDIDNVMKLAVALTGLRAVAEQTIPDMLLWENRKHAGRSYVRVGPSDLALEDMRSEVDEFENWDQLALYYVPGPGGLTLSLNEELVKRAIDRSQARRGVGAENTGAEDGGTERAEVGAAEDDASGIENAADASNPWLGKQLGLRVSRDVVELLEAGMIRQGIQPLQELSWNNLPILNEWKRRWPQHDPVDVHETLWGRRLLCPGGGEYRWNADDQRMESSLYGHPGRPLVGPVLPSAVKGIGSADLGIDFEEDGLRGRVTLTRQ